MRADEDDMQRFYAREGRRNPPAYVDIEDHPTAQQIAAKRVRVYAELQEQIIDLIDRDAGGVLGEALLALVGGEGSFSARVSPAGDLIVDVSGPAGERTIHISMEVEKV